MVAKSNDLWGFFFAQICCHWPLYPATFGQANPVAKGRRTAAQTIISDLLPVVGYTDDIGVLLAAIAAIAFYIKVRVSKVTTD